MSTKPTEAHDATPAAEPLALKSNEGLGPLPEAFDSISVLIEGGDLEDVDVYNADHMHAYAAAAVAAERERCAALVESRAGVRGTGAWSALIAAADAIRA